MTIKEAAHRIGKSTDTIRRAIRDKKVDAHKVNGIWDVSENALSAYAKAQGYISTAEEYENPYAQTTYLREQNSRLLEQIEKLQNDLREQKERSDMLLLQMTRQLEQSQRLLEYRKTPFWRRWFRKRGNDEPENH